jgi:hypothetical protein
MTVSGGNQGSAAPAHVAADAGSGDACSAGSLQVDRIVFIGRTYDEYVRFFDLGGSGLFGRPILDCAAGASSFGARAHRAGARVTAADPLYGRSRRELWEKGVSDLDRTIQALPAVQDNFRWDEFRDPEGLRAVRLSALADFVADFDNGRATGRYVTAALPSLPFADRQFELVLSANFLFLYGDRLDLEFHLACLRELYRVAAGEVRIFPLVGLDGLRYPHLAEALAALEADGIASEIREVPYEFQRGARHMLRLSR